MLFAPVKTRFSTVTNRDSSKTMPIVTNVILVFSASVFWTTGTACDYQRNADGYQHTMCEYSGQGPACQDYKKTIIGAKERKTLVDTHNKLRQKMAIGQESGYSGARQMYELKWDDELATIAQRWADQCTMVHDKNRDIVYRGKKMPVGQNLGQHNARGKMNYKNGVERWYNSELSKFSSDMVPSYVFDTAYGHFTQVVWGTSKKVGCGISRYTDALGPVYLLVCNYAPSGNYEGEPVYEIAESDSDIGNMCKVRSKRFSALCAPTDNLIGSSKSSKERYASSSPIPDLITENPDDNEPDFASVINDNFGRIRKPKRPSAVDNVARIAKEIESSNNLNFASGSRSVFESETSNDDGPESKSGSYPSEEYGTRSYTRRPQSDRRPTDRSTYDSSNEDDGNDFT